MDRDLSNVVQKCRPTKAIPIDLWQLHLFGDQVGVHSHALTVATGATIMDVEGAGEHENFLGGNDGRIAHAVVFRLLHSSSQVSGTSRLARHGHSFRGLVGKHQCHLQQHCEWKQSARQLFGHGQHDQWCAQHHHPPSNCHADAMWRGQCACNYGRRDDRKGNRSQKRRGADERRKRLVPSPPVGRTVRRMNFVIRVVHSSPSQGGPTPSEATIVLRSWSEAQIDDNSKRKSVVNARLHSH